MKAALLGLGRMGLRHLEVMRSLNLDVVGVFDMQEPARAKAVADYRRAGRAACSRTRAR